MRLKFAGTSICVVLLPLSSQVNAWEKVVGNDSPGVLIDGESPGCWFGLTFHHPIFGIEPPGTITTYDTTLDGLGRLVEYSASGTGNGHPIETHLYGGVYNAVGRVTSFEEDRTFPESGNEYHIVISNAIYNSAGKVESFDATVTPDDVVGDFCGPNFDPPDGYVDVWDLMYFADHWHTRTGEGNWDLKCDLTGPNFGDPDGYVDVWDLMTFADHWHEGEPP